MTWYHGGLVGRAVGELLLPSSVTGANPRSNPSGGWTPKARVYVTHYEDGAAYFTGWNVRFGKPSAVYVVEPHGELTIDPEALRIALLVQDDPFMVKRHLAHVGDLLSRFGCDSATVLDMLEVARAAVASSSSRVGRGAAPSAVVERTAAPPGSPFSAGQN